MCQAVLVPCGAGRQGGQEPPELAEERSSGQGVQAPGAAVHLERAPVLRRYLSVAAANLATTLEELAQIHEELAGRDPPQASEYRGSAEAARKAAHQVREIARQFSD